MYPQERNGVAQFHRRSILFALNQPIQSPTHSGHLSRFITRIREKLADRFADDIRHGLGVDWNEIGLRHGFAAALPASKTLRVYSANSFVST